jgi:Protein of unknown function (DUF1569)
MAVPIIYNKSVSIQLINRINQLSPGSLPKWGKMSVSQMLAHCNVSYEYIYEPGKYKPTAGFMKLIMKLFVKNAVVSEKPYKQNSPTGPDFKVSDDKNFEQEKERLIGFIEKTASLGSPYFEGKESHSFGKLTATEWSNMLFKHLDHHLSQFGV